MEQCNYPMFFEIGWPRLQHHPPSQMVLSFISVTNRYDMVGIFKIIINKAWLPAAFIKVRCCLPSYIEARLTTWALWHHQVTIINHRFDEGATQAIGMCVHSPIVRGWEGLWKRSIASKIDKPCRPYKVWFAHFATAIKCKKGMRMELKLGGQ